MRYAPLFALALLAASPEAFAAETPPASAAATSTPSQGQIDAAMDLLAANHALGNIEDTLDVIMPRQAATLRLAHPDLDDSTVATIMQGARQSITARKDEMLRVYATTFARHFSEQELRDLAAFYRSDLGRKYTGAVPGLMKEAAPSLAHWMSDTMIAAQEEILASLRKHGLKT